jgi:hypothetical protein
MLTGRTVALEPIETLSPIFVARHNSRRPRAGLECVVDEHHSVPDETIVANLDKLAYEAVRLNLRARADPDSALDLDERPNKAVRANFASIQIDRLHDLDAFAKTDILDPRSKQNWRPVAHYRLDPSRLSLGWNRRLTEAPVSDDS